MLRFFQTLLSGTPSRRPSYHLAALNADIERNVVDTPVHAQKGPKSKIILKSKKNTIFDEHPVV